MDRNPYAAPESATEAAPQVAPDALPSGLAGWLVIVAIGLIVTPFRLALYLSQTFPPIFKSDTWDLLTTPGGPSYHPFWAPLLVGEIIVNMLFIGMAAWLLVLFFRKSAMFPKTYIVFVAANALFILGDALAVRIVLPDQPMFDSDTLKEFVRSLVAVCIWIPYMLLSRRVKNTFVY